MRRPSVHQHRNTQIFAAYRWTDATERALAARFNLSAARIHQIVFCEARAWTRFSWPDGMPHWLAEWKRMSLDREKFSTKGIKYIDD
jgi:hypothetical protein